MTVYEAAAMSKAVRGAYNWLRKNGASAEDLEALRIGLRRASTDNAALERLHARLFGAGR